MIVGKRTVLVVELVPQRDGGFDDLDPGGATLPLLREVSLALAFGATLEDH